MQPAGTNMATGTNGKHLQASECSAVVGLLLLQAKNNPQTRSSGVASSNCNANINRGNINNHYNSHASSKRSSNNSNYFPATAH